MDPDERRLRQLSALLGLGAAGLGAPAIVAPAFFGRLFGMDVAGQPAVQTVFRSVGARDLAMGVGLWSAAVHGSNFAPWLLARALSDSGDTLATLIAIRQGARSPRFIALSLLALVASATGWSLWFAARERRRWRSVPAKDLDHAGA
jgi:hypothetical protein